MLIAQRAGVSHQEVGMPLIPPRFASLQAPAELFELKIKVLFMSYW